MARVLVIGGTLFIGRALVDHLLARGDEVVIMHRGRETPFEDRVGQLHCDRNDIPAVRAALEGTSFDVVFDNVYDWQRGTSAEQVSAAAMATSPGLHRYVFMSSVAVYPEGGEYDESDPLVAADHANRYGAQKAASERALFELQHEAVVPVTTLRPAFVFGPHNPFDREAFFWDRIVAGRPVIIPGDGSNTMQWVYSHDVARTAVAAAGDDRAIGQAYNLGNNPPITQDEFVEMLARVAGKPAQLIHIPRDVIQRAGGQLLAPPLYFGAFLDLPPISVRVDRIRTDLGIELTPLEAGLRETYSWYRQQRRPQPDFAWEDSLLAG